MLPGGDGRFGPAGTFGWGGAAGTVWWIGQRQGNMVFMTQLHASDSYPVRDQISAAIEADLKVRQE